MREYACLMVDFEQPEFIKEIQKKIPKKDLYLGETQEEIDNNEYGLETESHMTIVYGLDNNVKFKDLEKCLFPIEDYKTMLVNISIFENTMYDVLKVDLKCKKACESNKQIMDNFDVTTDYKDFHPHMTIAYMQKGKANDYKKSILDKIEIIEPIGFNYSYYKNGKDINEFYK